MACQGSRSATVSGGARHGISGAIGSRARAESIAGASDGGATVANGTARLCAPDSIRLACQGSRSATVSGGARHGIRGAVGSRARTESIAGASDGGATVANGAAAASSPGETRLTRDAAGRSAGVTSGARGSSRRAIGRASRGKSVTSLRRLSTRADSAARGRVPRTRGATGELRRVSAVPRGTGDNSR